MDGQFNGGHVWLNCFKFRDLLETVSKDIRLDLGLGNQFEILHGNRVLGV